MTTRMEIDQKYLSQANQLEAEFFNIVDELDAEGKKIGQHRVLKAGKSINEFNQRHGEIWKAHEAELISERLLEPRAEPQLARDLFAELDSLKADIQAIKKKVGLV